MQNLVLICGGTDWYVYDFSRILKSNHSLSNYVYRPKLGRKERGGGKAEDDGLCAQISIQVFSKR